MTSGRIRLQTSLAGLAIAGLFVACAGGADTEEKAPPSPEGEQAFKPAAYGSVALTADLGALTPQQREMLPLLIGVCRSMNELFWEQVFGPSRWLTQISDPQLRRLAAINYGPWDRLSKDRPFLPMGGKPAAARFYPRDLQLDEFAAAVAASADGGEALRGRYTLITRTEDGSLVATPYHVAFVDLLGSAASKLREASALTDDAAFANYLELTAQALETDDYGASARAWMATAGSRINAIIGPLDTDEDYIYRRKAAYSGTLLLAVPELSARLEALEEAVPGLIERMPPPLRFDPAALPEAGFEGYDLLYCAGRCNAGPKRIVIEMPLDPALRARKGVRHLVLNNVIRGKHEKSLLPIAERLIEQEQKDRVTFPALLTSTAMLEIAQDIAPLPIPADTPGPRRKVLEVAEALRSSLLSIFMAGLVAESASDPDMPSVEELSVTYVASLLRSIRLRGGMSVQGPASLVALNLLSSTGAIARREGGYAVDPPTLQTTARKYAVLISQFRDQGDWDGIARVIESNAAVSAGLGEDLAQLAAAGVPVDVAFEQGLQVLGLQPPR